MNSNITKKFPLIGKLVRKRVWIRDPRRKEGGYYAYRWINPKTETEPKVRIISRRETIYLKPMEMGIESEQPELKKITRWYIEVNDFTKNQHQSTQRIGPYRTRFSAMVDALRLVEELKVIPRQYQEKEKQVGTRPSQELLRASVEQKTTLTCGIPPTMFYKAQTVMLLSFILERLHLLETLKKAKVNVKRGNLSELIDEVVYMLGKGLHDQYSHPEGNVLKHTIIVLKLLQLFKAPYRIKLAGLLHDIGKGETMYIHAPEHILHPNHDTVGGTLAKELLLKHRFPHQLASEVSWLVKHHMLLRDWNTLSNSEKIEIANHFLFEDLYYLTIADWTARFLPDIVAWLQGKPTRYADPYASRPRKTYFHKI